MRFVPVKTAEQQAALMLAGLREQLINRRTQLSNAIRGYAGEFGLTAARGLDKIEPRRGGRDIAQDDGMPRTGGNPQHWPGRGLAADNKGHRSTGFPLRSRLCGVARAHPEGSFHRRPAATRRHHPRRRRDLAQDSGRGRHSSEQAGSMWKRTSFALAGRASQAQATQTCRCSARQQNGSHRREADGQWRTLQSASAADPFGSLGDHDSAARTPSKPLRAAFGGGLRPALTALSRWQLPWSPSGQPNRMVTQQRPPPSQTPSNLQERSPGSAGAADNYGSRPSMKLPTRQPPRTRREFHDGRKRKLRRRGNRRNIARNATNKTAFRKLG
jgi:hypothetical protein